MSVFAGGFRREAGDKVATASLRLLLSLVDKSLLRRNPVGRYEMLATVRQYAGEKLQETPEVWAAVQDRHCGFYADFLYQRGGKLSGAQQNEALREIGEDIENVRKAWDRAVDARRGGEIGKSPDGLFGFYDKRGWYQEGLLAFGRAATALGSTMAPAPGTGGVQASAGAPGAPETGAVPVVRARSLARWATFSFRLGHYAEAKELFQTALARFQQRGGKP